jgi:putative SOS response-associated peptidase YedK
VWRDPAAVDGDDADPLFTTAIVTTAAEGPMADIHDRTPLILPRRLWDDWLGAPPEEAGDLRHAVADVGVPRLEVREITERVNNVRNDGPELLEAAADG